MWEFLAILLIVGALVIIAGPMIMRRRRAGADWPSGTLLVTGISPRPSDVTGQQYATITGVINGPTLNEHVVYQRLEVDVDDWPTMGQLLPVVYSPTNPDNWRLAPQDAPPTPGQGDTL